MRTAAAKMLLALLETILLGLFGKSSSFSLPKHVLPRADDSRWVEKKKSFPIKMFLFLINIKKRYSRPLRR